MDFGFDVLVGRGVDGVAEFESEEFEELGAGALEDFSVVFGRDGFSVAVGEEFGEVFDGGFGVLFAECEDGVVSVVGREDFEGFESGTDAGEDGLAPGGVVFAVGDGGVDEVLGGEGSGFAFAVVVDDESVDDGSDVVAEASLGLVGSGEFAFDDLGPELLSDLVGEVAVAEFGGEVVFDGVVISSDEGFEGALSDLSGHAEGSDVGPVGGDVSEARGLARGGFGVGVEFGFGVGFLFGLGRVCGSGVL